MARASSRMLSVPSCGDVIVYKNQTEEGRGGSSVRMWSREPALVIEVVGRVYRGYSQLDKLFSKVLKLPIHQKTEEILTVTLLTGSQPLLHDTNLICSQP